MAILAIRFRTNDTRASWARKLNKLLAPVLPAYANQPARFEATPATLDQWKIELEDAVAALLAAGYTFGGKVQFRMSDTRQMWARKLNVMSGGVAAGRVLTVTVVAVPTTMAANGTNTSTLTATVRRADGTLFSGAVVTWSRTGTGTLPGGTTTTNGSGVATKILTAPAAPGSAVVTAATTGGIGQVTVTFT